MTDTELCASLGEQTTERRLLHDFGFFGHFLHVHAGGRNGKQHILTSLYRNGGHMAQSELARQSCVSSAALSEVISKLAAGTPIPNIVAGVHESVVERTHGLAKRAGVTPNVAMTGGVALNDSLRERLERRIGLPVATSPLAQFVGAYGAALHACEHGGDA